MAMNGGLWRDEKRTPGPWPQGKRAPLAIILVVVALLAFSQFHNKTALAIFVIGIGFCAFYCAARPDPERHREERYTRGSGWWLGVIMSKTTDRCDTSDLGPHGHRHLHPRSPRAPRQQISHTYPFLRDALSSAPGGLGRRSWMARGSSVQEQRHLQSAKPLDSTGG